MTKIDYDDLKKGGVIQQRDSDYVILRVRNIAGRVDSNSLAKIKEIAEKYGKGYVRCTTMQGIEIPWIGFDDISKVRKELDDAGILHGACGPRIRTIMSCPGSTLCKYGIFDTTKIAKKLDDTFFGKEKIKHKTKISVTGCPNSCALPRAHDIGLIARLKMEFDETKCTGCGLCAEICKPKAIEVIDEKATITWEKCNYCGKCPNVCPFKAWKATERGFDIYVGGRMGGEAQLGELVMNFVPETEVIDAIQKCTDVLVEHAKEGERLSTFINRVGLEWFKEQIE